MTRQILILSGIYPPDTGGPAKFAESFGNWCQSAGDVVTVMSYTNGEDIERSYGNSRIFLLSRRYGLPLRYFRFIRALYVLQKRADAVIINGCFIEVSLARLFFRFSYSAKIPGDIVWERARNSGLTSLDIDSFQLSKTKFKLKIMRFFFSRSLRQANKVIVPSTHLKQLAKAWGVPDNRTVLIYNSIDLKGFAPSKKVQSEFDVLAVCRLVPWKGMDEVIRVCASLNLSLCVVGDGPEGSNLKKLTADLNARVTFLGEVSQQYLPEIYSRAKFFVLNSSFEATSYALLEARASGLVCIANANTGSEEIIAHNEDGFICNGQDGLKLTQALEIATDMNFDYDSFSKLAVLDTESRFNVDKNFKEIRNRILDRKIDY
jgi:glycosyltransferase involved in cell wall biosynthesis